MLNRIPYNPSISFTVRSAILTAPTNIKRLNTSSPTYDQTILTAAAPDTAGADVAKAE